MKILLTSRPSRPTGEASPTPRPVTCSRASRACCRSAGSDAGAIRTLARKDGDGWILNGSKIWTSSAHENDWFVCLCRTSPIEEGNKHQGLSQMIIDTFVAQKYRKLADAAQA